MLTENRKRRENCTRRRRVGRLAERRARSTVPQVPVVDGRRAWASERLDLSCRLSAQKASGDATEPCFRIGREVFRIEPGEEEARIVGDRVEEGRGFGRAAPEERPGHANLAYGPCERDI